MSQKQTSPLKLNELVPNQHNVTLLCKIVSVNRKTVRVRGAEKTIYYGVLLDSSGKRAFNAWIDLKLRAGQVVHIRNAYTTVWQNQVEVNLSERTEVTASTGSISLQSTEYKLGELVAGLRDITVTGRVLSIETKTVSVKGVKKVIYHGTLGDETCKVRFTAWVDMGLNHDEVVRLTNCRVTSSKGIIELNLDADAHVAKLDDDVLPRTMVSDRKLTIEALLKLGGGIGISLEGFVLDVKKGSGLIFRCPKCRRAGAKGRCTVHGKVNSVPDLRLKCVIDDGTATVNLLLNRVITEQIIGRYLEDIQLMVERTDDMKAVEAEMRNELLVRPVSVTGYALKDEFGVTFIADELKELVCDINDGAQRLLEGLL